MKKLLTLLLSALMLFTTAIVPGISTATLLTTVECGNAQTNDMQPKDAPTLDEALNVEGGSLTFFCMGVYQWEVERDFAKAGNSGVPGTSCNLNTSIDLTAGQRVSFRFSTSCNPNDASLSFNVNHQLIESWSGENDWTTYEWTASEDGNYFFAWTYYRGPGEGMYDDNSYIDDVCVLSGSEQTSEPSDEPTPEPTPEPPTDTPEPSYSPIVTSIEIQSNATVYPGKTVQLNYAVIPENIDAAISFESSDNAVATVDENGIVTGVGVGTAVVTMTVENFTSECLVTVEELEEIDIYGYLYYAPDGESKYWMSFKSNDPRNVTAYPSIITGDTFGAAIVGDTIYGYNNSNGSNTYGPYYKIFLNSSQVEFPGSTSGATVVLNMAFDYVSQKLYALVTTNGSDNYIYEIERETGAMTRICSIPLPTYEGYERDKIWTFAIDADGTAYCVVSHVAVIDNAYVGQNGILCTLNLETGELTEVADTGIPTYYIQSMTFDLDNDRLYWANLSNDTNGTLYTLDKTNGNAVEIGNIATEGGAETLCLCIPCSLEITEPEVEVSFVDASNNEILESITCTPGHYLSDSDYPEVPIHDGLMFTGWDYLSDREIYFDTVIYANYCDASNPLWSFETEYQYEQWRVLDEDGDGNYWFWSEFNPNSGYLYAYDGERCMASESYSNSLESPLTPDNWLLSPEINLLSDGTNQKLTFYIRAQTEGYEDEHLGVYISMDGGQTWGDEIAYFTTTAEYVRCEVDLSDYAGLNIVVAFRHYNSSNQFILNLDCVQIENGTVTDDPITPEPPTVTPEPPTATPEPPTVTPEPTDEPTSEPTAEPSDEPTDKPSDAPTTEPTGNPTAEPTDEPTIPETGAFSLVGVGLAAILTGAGAIAARKKEAE